MEEIVLAGVRYLDSLRADWETLIDWEALDIESLHNCIVGQLMRYVGFGLNFNFNDHIKYGFEIEYPHEHPQYAELNEAWKAWHRGGCMR